MLVWCSGWLPALQVRAGKRVLQATGRGMNLQPLLGGLLQKGQMVPDALLSKVKCEYILLAHRAGCAEVAYKPCMFCVRQLGEYRVANSHQEDVCTAS